MDHYTLPRGGKESSRLNAQHNLYKDLQGYLLHPTIAASLPSKNCRIADIACGTGTWLLDLASSLPSHTSFTGLDISSAQFPSDSDKPANVSFRILNILEPVPEDLKGHFDAINLRLLICGLKAKDWSTAASNAKDLLKPNGWIQWCEGDFANQDVCPPNDGQGLRDLLQYNIEISQKNGKMLYDSVRNLRTTIEGAGLKRCEEVVVSTQSQAELTESCTWVEAHAMYGLARSLSDDLKATEALIAQCEEGVQRGCFWSWNIHLVIGQKSS
ncbi:hypothetical protein LTR62_002473 [Meristemomyces frigidus]|uniref:Methyltransferase type 12 domain-containing protein n=1 Tax=Meristemomyces frigidus TaxID=1508187 RepID=A0AAN7TKZ9_9PEZI|nr:hypothetical protein LTR62_002473 [Meristemomyces frigidus]